jgi:hypothetical protein
VQRFLLLPILPLAILLLAFLAPLRAAAQDAATPPSHDWRSPGFVSTVGGRLFDPACRPLNSAGANIPNLLYHYPLTSAAAAENIDATLAWLHGRHFRWLRVFATGHGLPGPDSGAAVRAPQSADEAIAALRFLLDRVQAFNASRPPEEALYVLVALTDYYPAGVPGDRFAYDHPVYRGSPVLPAPWYRAGVWRFDFEQEHGFGRLTGLPNYEGHYLPWVRQIVAAFAEHPAVMGWQLGNELKARNSPRNGITPDEAYGWYLAFTRDVVDVIREYDRNHLIFMGAQYMAELVDWEYRPRDVPEPALLPTYRHLVRQALDACGRYCWNVWGLTSYDFNLYAVDDAMVMAQHGVTSVFTEYGFTRGTAEEMERRFGQDHAAAIRRGYGRSWVTIDGERRPYLYSAADLVLSGLAAGISPWGAPAPGATAILDADWQRGITLVSDEAQLWSTWRETAARLEAANRAAGISVACLAHDSR